MTPETVAMYVVIGALWLISAVSIVTVHCGASEKLSRNKFVGIRTPGTLASDAGWRAGHRAAIPVMWLTVPVAAALSVAMTSLGPRHNYWWATVVLVAVLIVAAVVANRAARRVGGDAIR
jgi:peptidoglycan/LPS O-acetylase OafA/YrhL